MTQHELPAPGLGTATLGLATESCTLATINRAPEAGLRHFDTAPPYGVGLAEERLGRAWRTASADVVVSTKCGRTKDWGTGAPEPGGIPDHRDFSEATTRASVDRSCQRLYRDRPDIVFLHDIEAAPAQAPNEALPTLRELKAKGVIGLVGAGCDTVAGMLQALDAEASDVVPVAGRRTLLGRTAGSDLLSRTAALGTRVVCGGILNSGLLVEPDAPGVRFDDRPAEEAGRGAARYLSSRAQVSHFLQQHCSFPAGTLVCPRPFGREHTGGTGQLSCGNGHSRPGCLREQHGRGRDPRMIFANAIEAHMHLWDPARNDDILILGSGPWLASEGTVGSLRRHTKDSGVAGTIVVQSAPNVGHPDWLRTAAHSVRGLIGVVAWIDPSARNALDCADKLASDDPVCGVRLMLNRMDAPDALLERASLDCLQRLAETGLAIECLAPPDRL